MKSCDETVKANILPWILIYLVALFMASLVACLSYVFVEKPAIDASKVLKRKENNVKEE